MKRVLIIIGDAGGGHRSAANALEEAFRVLYGDRFSIKTIDIFTEAGVKPFKDSAALYVKISANLLAEFIYDFVALILSTRVGYYFYRTYVNAKLYRAAKRIVEAYAPHILIANNSVITPLMGKMKREGARFVVACLVTDIMHIFRGWGDRSVDCIISPTHEATKRLVHFGVDRRRIRGPLFPINPRLASFRPREVVLKELGFRNEGTGMKTILLTAGGVGLLSLRRALDDLAADERLQLIILAGRVPDFQAELERRHAGNPRVKVFGFIDNIQDYYTVADVVVCKPGPATILEAELFQKKTILTKRVGVQETGNAAFALRNPNFKYIGGRLGLLRKTIQKMLARDSLPFPDRRSFDECAVIVREIVRLHDEREAASSGGRSGSA